MPDIDPAGNSIWFSAIPACSCVQLDLDLFCTSCTSMRLATEFYFQPPGPTTAGPRASIDTCSRPVAAVVLVPIVCCAGAGYRLRRLNPMLASIHQPKTHVEIYYCGVVVQPGGQHAQGIRFNTRTMQFFSSLKYQWT